MAETLRSSLPLWVRPLAAREGWVNLLANKARADLAEDPVGALCLVLMAVCLVLSVATARTAVISTSLLRSERGFSWFAVLHASALCLLVGLLFGLIASWFSSPSGSTASPDVLGRRVWIVGGISAGLCGFFYVPRLNIRILKSILTAPRHRFISTARFRRRRPRVQDLTRAPGFYIDERGQIHCVSSSGHSRSLIHVQGNVVPWNGPFDRDSLRHVHASAIVPFTRKGVADALRGFQRRKASEIEAAIKASEWRTRHDLAFELVCTAIDRDSQRVGNSLPTIICSCMIYWRASQQIHVPTRR